jgi:hypothetical protein
VRRVGCEGCDPLDPRHASQSRSPCRKPASLTCSACKRRERERERGEVERKKEGGREGEGGREREGERDGRSEGGSERAREGGRNKGAREQGREGVRARGREGARVNKSNEALDRQPIHPMYRQYVTAALSIITVLLLRAADRMETTSTCRNVLAVPAAHAAE